MYIRVKKDRSFCVCAKKNSQGFPSTEFASRKETHLSFAVSGLKIHPGGRALCGWLLVVLNRKIEGWI
jgi:hypothetical protein